MSQNNQNEVALALPAKVITDLRALPSLNASQSLAVDLSNRAAILEVIKTHAADPTIFDEFPPYVWAAEISSNRSDYYSTRMDPETTLRNFVEDAILGVTFLDSHQASEKLGRSFASVLVEDDLARVYAAFYTIPDVSSTRNSTNDLIKRIRSGIEKDVSVGFKKGENFMMRCSVCGLDMWRDWDCDHWQGEKTKVWDEASGEWREVKVFATIVDGRLAEVSGVYDGATPGALIEKALDFAKRGLLKPEQIRLLETQFRMVLPTKTTQIVGADLSDSKRQNSDSSESTNSNKGENNMSVPDDKNNTNPNLDFVRSTCLSLGLVTKEDEVVSVNEGVRALQAEIKTLRSVKQERDSFFEAEIEDARKEGVVAYGDQFDTDRYIGTAEKPGILKRCSLAEVRSFKKDWQAEAEKVASKNGGTSRRSSEDENAKEGQTEGEENTDETKREQSKTGDRVVAVENFFEN